MKVASALVAGPQPTPELVVAAVRQALAAAGLERAASVLLLLSRDFSRHPQAAILAAARTAGCLQVSGCTAHGVFTESGWQLDQASAAVMVFGAAQPSPGSPIVSLAGGSTLPYDWRSGSPRAGLLGSEMACWNGGRLDGNDQASFSVPAGRYRLARSSGLRRLGKEQTVTAGRGFEVQSLDQLAAIDSLRRVLPAAWRTCPPLHHIVALRHPDEPAIAILSANADGSLSLAERLQAGDRLSWAIRQPLNSEQEMRDSLAAAVDGEKAPDFALMFSCIGRGPLFYGGEDRDLLAFRERLPGVPLLGAYGSGQIAPLGSGNQLFQNTVVTLLFESPHV